MLKVRIHESPSFAEASPDVQTTQPTRRAIFKEKTFRQAYAQTYEEIWPTWQRFVHGRSVFQTLGTLEATQWFPPYEIEALQLRELRALLEYAGENVPYYRDLFTKQKFDPRSMNQCDDISMLPILTREIIQERYYDLIAVPHRGKNHRKGTSGSTGAPLKFEYSNESEAWRQSTRLRGYRWAGYSMGTPTLYYWPEGAKPARGIALFKTKVDRALRREVYVDPLRHDERSLRQAVNTIRRTRPHLIVGYTQALVLLGRFILERGLRDWGDIPVITGAEAVLPGDRSILSDTFGPGVFETYGSRETMLVGAECCVHDGLHLSEENLFVQVLRDNMMPARPLELGDVVITDLHNYGMPLIRYANGDTATMGDGRVCACGRGLRKLLRVEGRRADTLRGRDGSALPGMAFHALFATKEELARQFQAVQRVTGEVVLRIVRGQDWTERAFDPIVTRLRGYLRGQSLVVEFVEHIPRTASGKYRTIIAERS